MRSMTGFGRGKAQCSTLGAVFLIEISSVNRKQYELRMNLPKELSAYEPRVRRMVADRVSRGHLSLRADVEYCDENNGSGVKVNDAIFGALVRQADKLREKYNLSGQVQISDLLQIPGIIEVGSLDCDSPEVRETVEKAVNDALDELVKMREQEGQALANDIGNRIEGLRKVVSQIKPLADDLPEAQRNRLLQTLADAGLTVSSADERVSRELVIFADRSDVSEELTRLNSHFDQFMNFLKEDGPIGRGMDFLIQEINREINTVSNKAVSSHISPLIVGFKTELEKVREQVQNIE